MRRGPLRRSFSVLLYASLWMLLAACASNKPPLDDAPRVPWEVAGRLLHTARINGDFLMRQELRFRYGEQEGGFEAIVQKHCDEVVVIGLTPFGTRAFSIRQRGLAVEVDSQLAEAWPFPLESILLDVHRSFFYPVADPPPPDGMHELSAGPEPRVERWSSGRLLERRLRVASSGRDGELVIRYVGGATPGPPAREIELRNELLGYQLDVTTYSYQPLTCSE